VKGLRARTSEKVRLERPPLFLGYLLLHAFVVVGLTTPRFPDSETYLHLSLTGGALRLPTVPLLYKVLPTDPIRIAGQVLLASSAWWILSGTAGRMISDRRVRFGVMLVLLTLGLVGPISNWNSVILSESVAISLTVLVIACWLRYGQARSWGSAAGVLVSMFLWTFARQPHVLIGALITAVAVAAAWWSRDGKRIASALAVGLALITCAGLLELGHNDTLSKNTLMYMLKARIVPDASFARWFARHGMPDPKFDPQQPGRAVPRNPSFVRWLNGKGGQTYVEFVLAHPDYTFVDPLPYLSGEQESLHHPNLAIYPTLQPDPTPSILSPHVNYGRHRDVVPTVVQSLLFDEGQIGGLLLLAAGGLGASFVAWRRFGPDRRLVVPVIVVVSAIPQANIVWLSGGEATHELDRLSIVTGVSVRIGLWIVLALGVDRLVGRPRVQDQSAVV
jgi:hypothetical protein